MQCTKCSATGMCQPCKGSGHSGYFLNKPGQDAPVCSWCKGSGKCNACGGTGKIDPRPEIEALEKRLSALPSFKHMERKLLELKIENLKKNISTSEESVPDSKPPTDDRHNTLRILLAELDSQVGLANVKGEIEELINSIQADRARRNQGLRVADRSLHMVFQGNPGTGKTTVARLVAQIYKELGVLKKGHLLCTDRAGLVANYVGQTATKVAAVVSEAVGGVLFIDEAYSLAPADSSNDFGQEAIQQLLLLMENHRNELVVITAGYPEEMARFLDANPGLNSRFTRKLHFEDYSPEELLQIFEKFCRENDYRLQEITARDKLLQTIQTAYDHRDRTFGNARFARNLFEEATRNLANRVVRLGSLDRDALTAITHEDIPKPTVPTKTRDAGHLPDLGKYLANKGMPQKTALVYNSWVMDVLTVVGRGCYCTTLVQPMDGEKYCATFDFGDEILKDILARAPAATKAYVGQQLAEDSESIRHIRMPVPIHVGILATLGNLKQGLNELFIPLVIAEVFGYDPTALMEELTAGDSDKASTGLENAALGRTERAIEQIRKEPEVNTEVTKADVNAICEYCRSLARKWWRIERRNIVFCDICNSPVMWDEGFLMDDYLYCETCFEPSTKPDDALKNLREDSDYYGEGLLGEARQFSRMHPRR